ncbi:MAG: hypothetical protein LBI74_02920 [Synergistaceae bacterium]|jgi:hypothetical protein|nr:hypothetical protein [Synergistaceae bacterium]
MFGLNPGVGRASQNFYRNVFALAAFIVFVIALLTDSPIFFATVVVFGTLSRLAVKKNWRNPAFSERLPWLVWRARAGDVKDDK